MSNRVISAAQAHHTVKTLAALDGTPVRDGRGNAWIREQVEGLLRTLSTGQVGLCPHVLRDFGVLLTYAWRPGHFYCPPCAPMPDPIEDGTCDRCQRFARELTTGVVAIGAVLLTYGLCRGCANEVGVDPEAVA